MKHLSPMLAIHLANSHRLLALGEPVELKTLPSSNQYGYLCREHTTVVMNATGGRERPQLST